ncbi:MAG: non-canonical purine NTP pyrophosphatase [Candidatus Krumholzibacteriia bacterium]
MGTQKRKVVLASRNPDKVRELMEILADLPFEVVAADAYPGLPAVVEDGTTIEGNATRKALVTAAWTGEIAVADDTSLQVRVLNGLPDIFAARFSGGGATYASNVELLLDLMAKVPEGSRQARFASACAWIDPRPRGADGPVIAPARKRWLFNPWARAVQIKDPAQEPGFWNGLIDRQEVWADYRTALMADLVAWGHDTARARDVAAALVDGRDRTEPGAVTVPDPRIWLTHGPMSGDLPRTHVAPSGLSPEAPGRAVNEEHFLQITATGRLVGRIARQPLGGGGFGYDPVFVPDGEQRTLAELPPEDKHAISHRGRALRRLLRAVRTAYGLQAGVAAG